jgi:hypothetical protein
MNCAPALRENIFIRYLISQQAKGRDTLLHFAPVNWCRIATWNEFCRLTMMPSLAECSVSICGVIELSLSISILPTAIRPQLLQHQASVKYVKYALTSLSLLNTLRVPPPHEVGLLLNRKKGLSP